MNSIAMATDVHDILETEHARVSAGAVVFTVCVLVAATLVTSTLLRPLFSVGPPKVTVLR